MKRLINLLLLLLGFSAVSCNSDERENEGVCMYGVPTVDFHLVTRVVDEENNPIRGIQILDSHPYESFGYEGCYTDSNGRVNFKGKNRPVPTKLLLKDVDGEENGGEFEDKLYEVKYNEVRQIAEGDGEWYNGSYKITIDKIVMTKKVKDPIIWDYAPFDPAFVIVDEALNNIATTDSDWLFNIEIEYNGEIYKVDPALKELKPSTMEYVAGPAELRYDEHNQTFFIFGEFTMGEDGEFKVRYKECEWQIRFDTNILGDGCSESKVYINDVETKSVKGAAGEDYVVQWFYQLIIPSEN